jgi:hypothetical protein
MRSLALVIGGLALASSLATAAAAQGIGEAARKERARRVAAPAKEPARVYVIDGSTSKDKGQPSDNAASQSGNQAETAVGGEPKLAAVPIGPLTDGPTDSNGKSESYWRGRYASAQSAIAAADQQVKDIELRIQQHGPIVPGPTAGACSDGAVAGWGESTTQLRDRAKGARTCDWETMQIQAGHELVRQLDAAKERAAGARRAMDDLQEEARRAGALPGWLR